MHRAAYNLIDFNYRLKTVTGTRGLKAIISIIIIIIRTRCQLFPPQLILGVIFYFPNNQNHFAVALEIPNLLIIAKWSDNLVITIIENHNVALRYRTKSGDQVSIINQSLSGSSWYRCEKLTFTRMCNNITPNKFIIWAQIFYCYTFHVWGVVCDMKIPNKQIYIQDFYQEYLAYYQPYVHIL